MTEKLFVDTNVVIDLLAHREPFYEAAKKIFSLADLGKRKIAVAAISFSTAAYILERHVSYEQLTMALRRLADIVEIAAIDEEIIRKSISPVSRFKDVEDAMQHHAALSANCHCIITRNVKDFEHSEIPVFSPDKYLQEL